MHFRHVYALTALLLMLPSPFLKARDVDVLPSIRARAVHHEPLRPAEVPDDRALEAGGATIGRIEIDIGNVFDTTDPAEDKALPRLANRLHIRTRQSTIESLLLFRPGDVYSGRILEESERVLRTTRFLYDATVRPVAYHDGKVDVKVQSRDVWTLNPGLSYGRRGGANTSGFELEELNLLGRGKQLSLGFKSNVDRDSTTLLYHDPQLFGTWWRLALQASNNSDGKTHELSLERPFYALDTRWAAGASGLDDERIDSQYDLGKVINRFSTRQRFATAYGGRSTGLIGAWARRWTAGFTYDENQFSRAPDALPTSFVPPDRKLVYPWIGYEQVQDRFFKVRNRDQIEKTEDFYLGWRLKAQLGYAASAFGSDRRAWIIDTGLSKGWDATDRQSVLLSARFTSRLEQGDFADALTSVASRYYFRQSPRRLFFLGLQADSASRLDPDQQLLLGGDNGLRGYPLRYQGGDGRWLFTAEQRWFTNWYPFRLFNVGGAVFSDIGRTWGSNPFGTSSQGVLKDVGAGLRLGNSRSALGNVLHIDVAFPLDGDRSIKQVQFLVETQRTF